MRLRWELSKVWKKPIDDPVFDKITSIQWMTYAALLSQDRQEEAEEWRERIEYMARFVDSKAVDQIQRIRERAVKTGESSDAFEEMLQRKFGRGRGLFNKIERIKTPNKSIQELGQQIEQAAAIDEIRVVKG